MKHICILPGDGIGPEVTGCAVRALDTVTDRLEMTTAPIGQAAYLRTGSWLPDDTMRMMRNSDSCLFGAVTSVEEKTYRSPVLAFRKDLDLYANLRPVRTTVQTPYTHPIDIVIVRENTEGMYTQDEVHEAGGVTTRRRVTSAACERIVRFSIDYALANGRRRVCCVHKSNVLKESDGLFVRTFREVMDRHGHDLAREEHLVDSAAMKLVTEPSRFDVIVTLNLYGDILSDVAAGVAGGLGFAPSGNIGPTHSVFEPAHGSAPDIAGKGVANPTAALLAAAMMLRHIDMAPEGERVERAVRETYAAGDLTVDVGGRLGSDAFTEKVIARILAKVQRT